MSHNINSDQFDPKIELVRELHFQIKDHILGNDSEFSMSLNPLFSSHPLPNEDDLLRFKEILLLASRLAEIRLAMIRGNDHYGEWVILILSAQKLDLLRDPFPFEGKDHSFGWNRIDKSIPPLEIDQLDFNHREVIDGLKNDWLIIQPHGSNDWFWGHIEGITSQKVFPRTLKSLKKLGLIKPQMEPRGMSMVLVNKEEEK